MRLLALLLFTVMSLAASNVPEMKERAYYGARLEPRDSVIHGAGQDPEAFAEYHKLMGENGLAPSLYMAYIGAKGASRAIHKWREAVERYPDDHMILQLGFSMTHDGQPEKRYEHDVAAGQYDDDIREMIQGLVEIGYPVMIRIGYEFNGPWNGYQPESYAAAFRHITNLIREIDSEGLIATVWCIEAFKMEGMMDFYPGDEYVDWWGIDVFAIEHFDNVPTFMSAAEKHGKPVIIGESTPRRVGVLDGEESWDRWFAKYFAMIREWPGLKAISYINWDWADKREDWRDWGNGRVQDNPVVWEKWKEQLSHEVWLHRGDRTTIRKALGLKE